MNIPPPDHPACVGEDPQLFEFDLFFDAGLGICQTCPVRSWCLRQVDPIRHNYFDGVAGGYIWKDGLARNPDPNDPIIVAYLGTRKAKGRGRPKDS